MAGRRGFRLACATVAGAIVIGLAAPAERPAEAEALPPWRTAAMAPARPAPVPLRERERARIDPDSVLVRFKAGVDRQTAAGVLQAQGIMPGRLVPGTSFQQIDTAGRPPVEVREELAADSRVAAVELNFVRTMSATPNDPQYAAGQRYLETMRLPEAWDVTKGAETVDIAVLDTGVDLSHPDLAARLTTGFDFVNNDPDPADDQGHGTMVAGVAAAEAGNGRGIAGAAWMARIMPVKVLDSAGEGSDATISAGVVWAADHGAEVINLSLGGPPDAEILRAAVAYAISKGSVVVAAAGNDGSMGPTYPAAYPGVVAVGGTDPEGGLTEFSTHGDWVDVAAPAWNVSSTALTRGGEERYGVASGTSFAAPLVSGVAALLRVRHADWTPAQVRDRLTATAADRGQYGVDPYYGFGLVDAAAALGGQPAPVLPAPRDANEPNDVPARAAPMTASSGGTIAPEGDVDWFLYEAPSPQFVAITVAPPVSAELGRQSMDPVLAVFDGELRLLAEVDVSGRQEVETLVVGPAAGGRYYIAVRSAGPSTSPGPYRLTVVPSSAPPSLFQPYQAYPTGSSPQTVAIADVTGDGRSDVIASTAFLFDEQNDYRLFLFVQRPDGTLAPPTRFPTSLGLAEPGGLATGDLDRDGDSDVALATGKGVELFLAGAGTLVASGIVPATPGAQQVEVADVSGDGAPDLVVLTAAGTLLLTHAGGTSYSRTLVTADPLGEIEIGDVSGDGQLDVVGFSGGMVQTYVRSGDGYEGRRHDTLRDGWPLVDGIEVADVNGDGRGDVVAAVGGKPPGSRLNVFHQNAAGKLDAPRVHPSLDSPEAVEAADMTGDGRVDVVVAHGGALSAGMLVQRTDGTLADEQLFPLPFASRYNAKGLALGDVNGDGATDIVVADRNQGLVVLRQYSSNQTLGPSLWVRDSTPAEGRTGVPADSLVTVTFARDLDPAAITEATLTLTDGRTGQPIPSRMTYDAATRTATLHPLQALQPGTAYVAVAGPARDTGGETFISGHRFSFVTASAAGAVSRRAGDDRVSTAAAVSAALYPPGVPVAYVATRDSFPDAGGPAAARAGGPLLLADRDGLPAATAVELARLRPGGLVVLGGPNAVDEGVRQALQSFTPGPVERHAGGDRFETAAVISAAHFPAGVPVAYVATGENFPDALAGGAAAAAEGAPLLLTGPETLSAATALELQRLRPGRIVVLGGTIAVSTAVESQLQAITSGAIERRAGGDRYETATRTSAAVFRSADTVFVATGRDFPDALAGVPAAGLSGAPLLLVDGGVVPAATATEIGRLGAKQAVILGGEAAIPSELAASLARQLGT
jgi:type VII secretion-associated serine protease mycosin